MKKPIDSCSAANLSTNRKEMPVRRVVTGHTKEGKAVCIHDGSPPRVSALDSLPSARLTDVWATSGVPALPAHEEDPTLGMTSLVPAPGETRFRLTRFPPDTIMEQELSQEEFAVIREEAMKKLPGLGEALDPGAPGMHTTDTVDYGIVISGEICLELDDGVEIHLRPGDCVVQNGTRHAWRNRGTVPCTMAFVMIGARRSQL